MREINGIEIYDLDELTYMEYVLLVNDNANITYEQAQRKLTRNAMLGALVQHNDKNRTEDIQYGNLRIKVKTSLKGNKKIIGIKNNEKPIKYWRIDLEKHREISRQLGLAVNR